MSVDWISVGVNIIKGIASGVASAAGQLVDAAVSAATDALNWVKSKLGIHSPSRVFRDQVGKNMALGIGVGFEDNIPYKDMENRQTRWCPGYRELLLVLQRLQARQQVDMSLPDQRSERQIIVS